MKDVDKEALLAERQKLAENNRSCSQHSQNLITWEQRSRPALDSDVREELEKTTRRITEIDEEPGQP
jgi:hypothetical protein